MQVERIATATASQQDGSPSATMSEETVEMARGPVRRAARQAPSSTAEDGVPRSVGNVGNYVFWLSFCMSYFSWRICATVMVLFFYKGILGQPLSVLLYYRAWFMREYPDIVTQAVNGNGKL
jgi:hypothetical protein